MTDIVLLITGCLIIALVELSMWKLFTRKVRGTVLPQRSDQSSLGILTVGKLRIFIIIHTIVMIVLYISTAIYAW